MDLMDYRRKIIANSPHLASASGAVATFSDGADLPLKSLLVDIEPVQDLHGYDSPWVAGGGVNKLPPMVDGTYTGNGLTAVVKNGIVTLSGTSTASGNALIIPLTEEYTVTQGYLHLCNSVANASFAPSFEGENISATSVALACSPVNRIGAIPSDKIGQTWTRVRVWISSGVTISGTYAPMVCEDNTVRQYAPYENICPISGWNAVKVTRVEVNLWDEQWEIGSYNAGTSTVQKYTDTTHIRSKNPISVKPNTTYYFMSASKNVHLIVADVNGNVLYRSISLNNGTFTTPSNGTLVYFNMAAAYGTTYNNDISINYPSTDHAYHPYNGVTVTVQLGETFYGGTLNPLTGVLTVDRAMVDLGTLDWRMSGSGNTAFHYANTSALGVATNISTTLNYICSNYSIVAVSSSGTATGMAFTSANQLRIRDATYASASDFKTAMDGVTLCYEVANPTEIQLTPHQIRTLYGNNNIFADTGNVALEYWAHP